jgi:hypothetical protein
MPLFFGYVSSRGPPEENACRRQFQHQACLTSALRVKRAECEEERERERPLKGIASVDFEAHFVFLVKQFFLSTSSFSLPLQTLFSFALPFICSLYCEVGIQI